MYLQLFIDLYKYMYFLSACIYFLFLPGYPHTLLKGETSLVRGSWLPLPINTISGDRTLCSHPYNDIVVP